MVKQFIKERLGTIILFAIVIIFVVWGVISINIARQNAITYVEDYVAPEATVDFNAEGKYESVAKTDSLELFYNEAKGSIQVKDLKSGHVWKGICDDEVYDLDSVNAQWKAELQSSLIISYNDLKKKDSGVTTQRSAQHAGFMSAENITNGIAVTYGFLAPGIYVTVEYVLDGDELVVRVPYEKIQEKSKYALTTLQVLPYFGAARNDNGGYLFYPDGSGAITTYEKVNTRPSNVKLANFFTYTNRSVTMMNMWNTTNYNQYTAAMPVYGIKDGDNAIFAACTKGEANSGIRVTPSGYVVDLNRAGFELYTRNTYNVNMYSMSTGLETSATGKQVQRVDKFLIPEDKEIRYFFLSGDKANYSGMADAYRSYLIEQGLLTSSIQEGDKMALALELLMGTTKGGMVFDEYIPMTTFEQVQEILDRLTAAGVENSEVVLSSWIEGNNYDNYNYWGPAGQLGGKSGMKDLNKYMESGFNGNLYLENQFTFASSDTKGLSEDEDIVYDGLNIEIAVSDMDGKVFYLLNPLAAFKRNNEFLKKIEKYDLLNVAYEGMGMYAYPDYNESAPYRKSEMVDQMRSLLESSENAGRRIAAEGANQYTYTYADYLYHLREDSFGLYITDYAVPFVQMVLSGMIPYSTEGAGNLSYDLQTQKLKWVEYGALPYFYLTYESALNLRDTSYDTLFSSTYEDWESSVADTYNEFKTNLSCVYGQQMVKHDIITDDLVRIEYANGVKIYINYANADGKADGVNVPAKSYVVVGGGEK